MIDYAGFVLWFCRDEDFVVLRGDIRAWPDRLACMAFTIYCAGQTPFLPLSPVAHFGCPKDPMILTESQRGMWGRAWSARQLGIMAVLCKKYYKLASFSCCRLHWARAVAVAGPSICSCARNTALPALEGSVKRVLEHLQRLFHMIVVVFVDKAEDVGEFIMLLKQHTLHCRRCYLECTVEAAVDMIFPSGHFTVCVWS